MKQLQKMIIVVAAALAVAGCGKNESQTPTGQNSQDATKAAAGDLRKMAEEAKATGEKVAADAAKQAQETAAQAGSKAQELIDKARSYVSETKYQDAANLLQQLSSLKLTPEQQKLVDSLKEQIQKALASKAASDAAGNLLKK